jgi:hypothetical protein
VWTFSQSSGKLYKNGEFFACCYSGIGLGLNNPNMQEVKNVGPLPRGLYRIGPAYNHPHLGPVTMNLEPINGTNTFGRGDFRIHPDSKANFGKYLASHGCIVGLLRAQREAVNNDPDKELEVVL